VPLSLAFQIVLALLWTAGCGLLVRRILATRAQGRLHTDQSLSLVAVASLAATPWISMLVYHLGNGQTVLGGIANLLVAAVMFVAARRARKARLEPSTVPASGASFQQKSATLMLLTLAVVYPVYVVMTWRLPALTVPLFLGSAVLITVVAIVGHMAIALLHVPLDEVNTAADERDHAAVRYGAQRAYYVLGLGMWGVPAVSFFQRNMLVVANVAFVFIVVAEIVKYASIVRYYGRGET
jgi:hypothetical protein